MIDTVGGQIQLRVCTPPSNIRTPTNYHIKLVIMIAKMYNVPGAKIILNMKNIFGYVILGDLISRIPDP